MAMTGEQGRISAIFDGGTTLGLGSAELLGRFAATGDEAAFSAIVAHHGPMVLATCRRILPNGADADDAFQATFLIFARQARSIAHSDRLAPWLHSVARRVAVRAKSLAARRKAVEGQGDVSGVAATPPPDDARELRAVLDEELARLPEKYRVPLVLCYLEGLTHDEAAGQLDWPVGTVRSRMAQARDRLRTRLARRGFAPESVAILFPSTLPMAAVSRALQVATLRLVITGASGKATTSVAAALLAQGVLTTMFLTKVQTLAIATLAVTATLAAGTAGVVAQQQPEPTANPTPNSAPTPNSTGSTEEGQPSSVDPTQPTRGSVDLAKELDAAKARIKALEAELAALKAPRPSAGDLVTRSPLPPLPPVPNVPDQPEAPPSLPALPTNASAAPPSPPAPPTSATAAPPSLPALPTNASAAPPSLPAPPTSATAAPPSLPALPTNASAAPPSPPAPPTSRRAGVDLRTTTPGTSLLSDAQKSGPWTYPLSGGRILYSPAERDRVTIFDSRSGTTSTFKDPGNIKTIVPVIGGNMVGLELEGPNVTEVVALNPTSNTWLRQKLREPLINGKVSPIVNQEMVYYGVGRSIYALSSQADHWGVLDLKQPLSPDKSQIKVIMTADSIIVPEDDMIHVFSPKTGEWTHMNTKDDK